MPLSFGAVKQTLEAFKKIRLFSFRFPNRFPNQLKSLASIGLLRDPIRMHMGFHGGFQFWICQLNIYLDNYRCGRCWCQRPRRETRTAATATITSRRQRPLGHYSIKNCFFLFFVSLLARTKPHKSHKDPHKKHKMKMKRISKKQRELMNRAGERKGGA